MKKQKIDTIVFELTPNPGSFDNDKGEDDVMFGTFKAYPKQPKKSKKKK